MATLNPEMSVSGTTKIGDIADVLHEVKPQDIDRTQRINITTDEIEEKDVAIQMLAVFIEELGAGFANYVDQASKILLTMITYEANDSIRNSVSGALPGLVKCVRDAHGMNDNLILMGRTYVEAIWKAV